MAALRSREDKPGGTGEPGRGPGARRGPAVGPDAGLGAGTAGACCTSPPASASAWCS
jgi:hypothetical protein